MKPIGIVRRIDDLGRVVIPKELRTSLSIALGDPLEIFADEGGMYLRKYRPGCTFCGGMDKLVEFGGTKVCKDCASKILGK